MTDADKKAVDTMIGGSDQKLPKDNSELGMHGTVGDPVLLRERGGRVDLKFIRVLQEGGCRLHLHSIVACRKLLFLTFCSAAEASIAHLSHRTTLSTGGWVLSALDPLTALGWLQWSFCSPNHAARLCGSR